MSQTRNIFDVFDQVLNKGMGWENVFYGTPIKTEERIQKIPTLVKYGLLIMPTFDCLSRNTL